MVRAKESKAKGFFFGILAAVSYGVNPLGAKYLYEEGLNVESVLFYRYGLAALIIGVIMAGKILAGKRGGWMEASVASTGSATEVVGSAAEFVGSATEVIDPASEVGNGTAKAVAEPVEAPATHKAPSDYETFRISKGELSTLVGLGVLFVVSSITLYCSFLYMDSGVACSLLFVYPVMTAVLMAMLYGEKITKATAAAIALSLIGVLLLYKGDGETVLSTVGVLLVMISALSYALYIIVANRASAPESELGNSHNRLSKYIHLPHRVTIHRLEMSAMKLSFYVLIVCAMSIVFFSLTSPERHLMPLVSGREWGYSLMLAIVPTVFSLISMGIAVRIIGSTPTAIMGALEPLTAVVIGLTVFHESLTVNLIAGILLILTAVVTIILSKSKSAA